FERTDYGAIAVIAPKGDLTGEDIDDFRRETHRCLESGNGDLIVDCSSIAAFDSAGLEALTDLRRTCLARRAALKLCRLDAIGRKIFEITRLREQFQIFDDIDAAIRSNQ